MATASAVLNGDGSLAGPRRAGSEVSKTESNVSVKYLERTEWYPMKGFTAAKGFDCSGIDASISITYRAFVGLKEAYTIPTSVALLCPFAGD